MNPVNSKTFCASAWFSVRNDNVERLTPCCAIDCSKTAFTKKHNYTLTDTVNTWHNSDYMQHLRKELNTGEFPPECIGCKNNEDSGIKSIRNFSNKSIASNYADSNFNDSWMRLYFDNKTNYTSDLIVSIDTMVSNFCNFECVMCNPLDSSKIKNTWNKNRHNKALHNILKQNPLFLDNNTSLIKNRNAIDNFHSIIIGHPINFLHVRGGEPFIDKHLLAMIKNIPATKKEKIRLMFNTNASVDLEEHINQLNGFKDVIIIASLDAIGPYAEYVRKHCVWEEIKTSIINAKNNTSAIVKVHCTVHALNILWLHQLEEWCDNNDLEMSFEFVDTPDFLSLSAVPPNILSRALKTLRTKAIRTRIKNYSFNKELHLQLMEYIDFYDITSNITFNDLLNKKGTKVPLSYQFLNNTKKLI